MLRALLLDLDDTLLSNPMSKFLPAYFRALAGFVADEVSGTTLMEALQAGMEAMEANDGCGQTNEEAFAAVFYPRLARPREALEPLFQRFYAEVFPSLRGLTARRDDARPLIEWARSHGIEVVVATNPVFPAAAIEQRLEWAGIGAGDVDYALVTTYEVMHATKSHPAYYTEILARLDVAAGECLMAGDDLDLDMAQAAVVGVPVYWVRAQEPHRAIPRNRLLGQGPLGALRRWLEAASDEALTSWNGGFPR